MLKIISRIIILTGVYFMVGSLGAMELDRLTISDTLSQIADGAVVVLLGILMKNSIDFLFCIFCTKGKVYKNAEEKPFKMVA
ncbi:MAG: hypothetical protein IJC89_04165 [Clostridia bacterium]|nr:hypothetical protein [Clostridia bacterium]